MKKLLSLNIQKFAEFNANLTDLIKKFTLIGDHCEESHYEIKSSIYGKGARPL